MPGPAGGRFGRRLGEHSGGAWRTRYEPGGVLRTANGDTEEDVLARTPLDLEAWVRADLAEKIDATRPKS